MRKRKTLIVTLAIIAVLYIAIKFIPSNNFVLGELGVKIITDRNLSDLSYTVSEGYTGPMLTMYSSSLIIDGKPCTLGVFYVINNGVTGVSGTRWNTETLELATLEQEGIPPQVKKFDNGTYLVFEPSQSACTTADDKKGLELEGDKRWSLWRSVNTASKI